MKKAFLIGGLIGAGWFFAQPRGTPFDGTRAENLETLREIVAEVDRDFPKRLDAYTTALSVEVTPAGVLNRYRLDVEDLQPGALNDLWEHLRESACENRGYRYAMAAGFTITFAYENRRGRPLPPLEIRQEDCPET